MKRNPIAQLVVRGVVPAGLALWLAYTLGSVVYLVAPKLRGGSGVSRIMSYRSSADADLVSIPGLVYDGLPGAALGIAEVLLVLLACVATLRGRGVLRMGGAAVLIAWTLLWAIGSVYMEVLSDWAHPTPTFPAVIGFALASVWCVMRWPSIRSSPASAVA